MRSSRRESPAGRLIAAKTSLHPHQGSPARLRREADIYAQGKTPIRVGGELMAWQVPPLGARDTGQHLREIQREFGSLGVQRSVYGLKQTRGEEFARSAVEQIGDLPGEGLRDGGAIGSAAANAIRASRASGALPAELTGHLGSVTGHDFGSIAIHDDEPAHRAAGLLNARAFTTGRQIYFAPGQYQPTTTVGRHLLAHEAAHALQQDGHDRAPSEHFRAAAGGDRDEDEATHFADAVTGASGPVPSLTASERTGLVHRAISFTHAHDAFDTNPVVADETAAGFILSSDPDVSFKWDTDVTIHGVAGDPFGNFQVGFLQVERVFYENVYWGSGANRTHRSVRPDAALPRRDADTAGSIFALDAAPNVAPAFAADGNVRSPSFDDTPDTERFPWANPVAGRVSNDGWFNYGDAFVTYLSARDTTAGAGAGAFRDLACVYWNLSAEGRFDTTQPVGNRVVLTSPGAVNHSGVIAGGSAEFPAMYGGNIANGHDTTTDT